MRRPAKRADEWCPGEDFPRYALAPARATRDKLLVLSKSPTSLLRSFAGQRIFGFALRSLNSCSARIQLWCRGEDSNLHILADTSPSSWRVYQVPPPRHDDLKRAGVYHLGPAVTPDTRGRFYHLSLDFSRWGSTIAAILQFALDAFTLCSPTGSGYADRLQS